MNEVGKKKVTATLVIVFINVLAFIVNIVVGGGSFWGLLLSGGGYVKDYGEVAFSLVTEQGQWWRLLTCGYLHMGIIHLVGNMAALVIIGNKVEEKIGLLMLILLYNFGTMLTAMLWCLIFRSGSIIGASLGIFVLLGILYVWLFAGRDKKIIELNQAEKRYLLIYVIIGCFLGIGTIVVHLIGFVIGILVGVVTVKILPKGRTKCNEQKQ